MKTAGKWARQLDQEAPWWHQEFTEGGGGWVKKTQVDKKDCRGGISTHPATGPTGKRIILKGIKKMH